MINFPKSHKILTEILNLPELKVISFQQFEGIGIILKTESLNSEKICPRCGTTSHRLHQNHHHVVKDLPWGELPVFLEINRRQFKCKKCQKPFSESLSFIGSRRNYTTRLANQTIKEVLNSNISAVAKKGIVTPEEIERMLKDAASKFEFSQPFGLKRLGIDEISLTKGKGNYCAVLIDLDKSELITILPERTQEELKEIFLGWGDEILKHIEEVSIDLWKSYKSLIVKLMPNAQVVADRFHVMKQINEELDQKIKFEQSQLKSSMKKAKKSQKIQIERKLDCLKSSKYALLKNESDLTEKQHDKLEQVKSVFESLKEMHILKEQIRKIFNEVKESLVVLELTDWLLLAQQHFPKSYKTIIRWFTEIVAYFDRGTTNGIVEGINNKLKLIKRSGYGFRNFNNFKTRCLLHWHFT